MCNKQSHLLTFKDVCKQEHYRARPTYANLSTRLSVLATKRCMDSLLSPFSGALPGEAFDLNLLMEQIDAHFLFEIDEDSQQSEFRIFSPGYMPGFIKSSVVFDLQVFYPHWVLLSLPNKLTLDEVGSPEPHPGLLAKLFTCLARLSYVARKPVCKVLGSLLKLISQQAKSHTLANYPNLPAVDARSLKRIPAYLNRQEYRCILLDNLERILGVAVAHGLCSKDYHFCKKKYEHLRSQINDLLCITRSLLFMAPSVHASCSHVLPFDDLLPVYSTLLGQHAEEKTK